MRMDRPSPDFPHTFLMFDKFILPPFLLFSEAHSFQRCFILHVALFNLCAHHSTFLIFQTLPTQHPACRSIAPESGRGALKTTFEVETMAEVPDGVMILGKVWAAWLQLGLVLDLRLIGTPKKKQKPKLRKKRTRQNTANQISEQRIKKKHEPKAEQRKRRCCVRVRGLFCSRPEPGIGLPFVCCWYFACLWG